MVTAVAVLEKLRSSGSRGTAVLVHMDRCRLEAFLPRKEIIVITTNVHEAEQ